MNANNTGAKPKCFPLHFSYSMLVFGISKFKYSHSYKYTQYGTAFVCVYYSQSFHSDNNSSNSLNTQYSIIYTHRQQPANIECVSIFNDMNISTIFLYPSSKRTTPLLVQRINWIVCAWNDNTQKKNEWNIHTFSALYHTYIYLYEFKRLKKETERFANAKICMALRSFDLLNWYLLLAAFMYT